jgi:hypothetical protein
METSNYASLFGFFLSDEDKKIYKTVTWTQRYKTFCSHHLEIFVIS